ncbi:MAG TPA: signal peptidase I [Candidatus Olsenella pullicola]|nr:signal peptidase I [Candidatus Olsenella pullicola]
MSEGYEPRHAASPKGARGRSRKGIPWPVGALLGGVAIAAILRLFVIGVYYVPSGSMLNTIHEGDLLLGEMVSLHFEGPKTGDVVTFDSPLTDGETLVKRVIAVGGQTIDLVDGVVYVDGEPLVEPYTEGKPTESLSDYLGSAGISYPYVVPEGTIWVMGDNRTNSKDSRFFGPVSVDDVTSRVLFIYWPLSHVGAL